MSHYRDLTPWGELGRSEGTLAVGWLAAGKPFARGAFPEDLLACLLCRPAELLSMGTHRCELCMPTANDGPFVEELNYVAGGSTVHLVAGARGITYAAPELIYHYIRDHGYAPPEKFVAALRISCAGRSTGEVRRADQRHAYERAVKAFGEAVEALPIAFTHPRVHAEDLIFYDLRAKTKFGHLEQPEDVEAIVLHRAPDLSPQEAHDAATGLWAAWQRFLGHEAFQAEWLQLSGPPS